MVMLAYTRFLLQPNGWRNTKMYKKPGSAIRPGSRSRSKPRQLALLSSRDRRRRYPCLAKQKTCNCAGFKQASIVQFHFIYLILASISTNLVASAPVTNRFGAKRVAESPFRIPAATEREIASEAQCPLGTSLNFAADAEEGA